MQDFAPVFRSMDPEPRPEPAPQAPEVRRGDGAFFAATTNSAGGLGDGRAAPVLPGGSAAPVAGGSAPHAHQTLPPVNWTGGAPNPPTGNHQGGVEQSATEEFALRLPDRAPSRNRAVIGVVLAAVLLIGVGVAAWAVFFNDSDPVGDDVYPTVVAEDLKPLPLGQGKKAKPVQREKEEPDFAPVPPPSEDPFGDDPERPTPPPVERPDPSPEPRRTADPEPPRFEPEPDPEPERPRSTPKSKPKQRRPKGSSVRRGFNKASKAIKACGAQHGAIAGTAFNVNFDVSNGRATNVKIQAPHSVTSLGRCVSRAVTTHARFGGGDKSGQSQRVKF